MRIHVGSDHAGFEVKNQLAERLRGSGHEVVDHGPFSYDEDDDYPVFCLRAAEAVAHDDESLGVVLGGSGNGEQISANKVRGIRAALAWTDDTARLARRAQRRESDLGGRTDASVERHRAVCRDLPRDAVLRRRQACSADRDAHPVRGDRGASSSRRRSCWLSSAIVASSGLETSRARSAPDTPTWDRRSTWSSRRAGTLPRLVMLETLLGPSTLLRDAVRRLLSLREGRASALARPRTGCAGCVGAVVRRDLSRPVRIPGVGTSEHVRRPDPARRVRALPAHAVRAHRRHHGGAGWATVTYGLDQFFVGALSSSRSRRWSCSGRPGRRPGWGSSRSSAARCSSTCVIG